MNKSKIKVQPKSAPAPELKQAAPPKDFHAVARDVFAKIKAKTGLDNAKVDAWQAKWLAMPQTRKKYEHLQDAPMVVLEESLAMANDIIDFVQGEEGGKSEALKKMKVSGVEWLHKAADFVKQKIAEAAARPSAPAMNVGSPMATSPTAKPKIAPKKPAKKTPKKKRGK